MFCSFENKVYFVFICCFLWDSPVKNLFEFVFLFLVFTFKIQKCGYDYKK